MVATSKIVRHLSQAAARSASAATETAQNPSISVASSLKPIAVPTTPGLQRAYVLPTLNNRFVFHPRLPSPRNSLEYRLIFAAFVFRKWRYQASEAAAVVWHRFAARAQQSGSAWAQNVVRVGNQIMNRKASDEYFLKGISPRANQVEFVYPASMDVRRAREQLAEWLQNIDKHRNRAFLMALMLPVNYLLSKVIFVAANILLVYHLFRFASSMRAMTGAGRLLKLMRQKRVAWTPSSELDDRIRTVSDTVTTQLEKEHQMNADGSENAVRVWRWMPTGDLHDDVVGQIQNDLRAHELLNTYRRTRMEYFVHSAESKTAKQSK